MGALCSRVGTLGRREFWVFILVALLPFARPSLAAETVVTLGFDDGRVSQYGVRDLLRSHGMMATFYIYSNAIGWSGYMTMAQLHDLQRDGHEIGGHTLDHEHLTTLSASEAERQICQDRLALMNAGFGDVTSFAYPYGEYNASIEQMVAGCGYSSARTVGGIGCSACPAAERIPPADPYATRTPPSVKKDTTLANMQNWVLAAEASGGGWVQIVIHDVCETCGSDVYAVSLPTLTAFLDWLAPRASRGTVVKRVRDVMKAGPPPSDDTTPPSSTISCNSGDCSQWNNGPVSVTLSAVDDGTGVAQIFYTTDGTEPGGPSGHSCSESPCYFSVSATTTVKYRALDFAGNLEATKSQTIRIDTQPPEVAITSPGNLAVVLGTVTVKANASDNVGIAQVRFYVDGRLIGTSTIPPYQATWQASGIGVRTLSAEAQDLAGNVTDSAPVTVVVAGLSLGF
jgi:peptidoglycan/xylan/chitin deacetylase (PgdA/CDA1 family)